MPGVYIRTAFIVGFPTETAEEFEELMAFVRETRFERLGAFVYSREDGTPAAGFKGQVAKKERERRLDVLMRAQAQIAEDFNRSVVGKTLAGIVDADSGRDDYTLEGRTYGDAPEVDGTVFAKGEALPGALVPLRITGVDGYDLLAEVDG